MGNAHMGQRGPLALLREALRHSSDVQGQAGLGSAHASRAQLAQMAGVLGLPEERVAQMAALVRDSDIDDAQLGSLMRMVTSKGLSCEQVMALLLSLGVGRVRAVRILQAQRVMGDKEAQRILNEERRAAQEQAADDRRGAWRGRLAKGAIIAFWLVVWQLVDTLVDNRLILTGPVRTLQALGEQATKAGFWVICGASFGRIALGFLLSFSVGICLALLSYRVRLVRAFVEPIVSLLRTIPVVTFIIMLLIWVGNQALTIYLSFLIVLPLIYTNMLAGFESVDTQMLEMARVFRLSRWRTFMYVYRPAFMPFLSSSCKISLGMSWKSGIMAEVLATPKPSIGKEMSQARTYLDTPSLFAWTVVVMVLSWLFEKAFMALLKRVGRPLGGLLGKDDDR